MTATPPSTPRDEAVGRIKSKRAFTANLVIFLLVSAAFAAIWLATSDDGEGFWPIWPIGLWGIGLAGQGWMAYGPGSRPITDDAISREMARR